MCTMLAIAVVTLCHEYMRADFMDKALTAEYGQEYLTWREDYEYPGFKPLVTAIKNAQAPAANAATPAASEPAAPAVQPAAT